MKNFIFVIFATFVICFASCGNKTDEGINNNDSIDNIDTITVDTIVNDSVVC